ncbi:MAG TPA: type 1 glutamine amidotransferase [Acidimicrobiales bacterium]|nr:type 1 glutamine amidotransferase [Acidimicrobiales bacterium]
MTVDAVERDRKRAVVLQHIACEPPGIYEDVLVSRGIEVVRAELDEGDPLPDLLQANFVVAMGGPMSVNDETGHAWIADEKRQIARAVAAGVPFFGVCLGAQLLAASLGAPVRAGDAPEVGILPVELTEAGRADPVLSGLAESFPVLQWHGDTFELPAGAVHLGRSDAYANQAFRVGGAYGIQFHLEVTGEMLEEWSTVPAYVASLQATLGDSGFEALSRAFDRAHVEMANSARGLFEAWLDQSQREFIQKPAG